MTTRRSQGNIQDLISPEDELNLLEKALIIYQNKQFKPDLNFEDLINEYIPVDKSIYRDTYNDAGVKHYVGSKI